MKIDIYTHVMPERYKKALYKYSDKFATEKAVQDRRPALTDHEMRLRILDGFPDVVEVLSATMPPVEEVVGPREATDMAKMCNDEMAELVARNPKKYIAAIANLPLNDIDATLKETERAIKVLGFKGVQVHTRVLGKPLTTPEMMPLYEMMCGFDLPIWIHPMRSSSQPDYASETVSYNQIFSIFGWPFDTTVAMIRLVFAGIFEKFPNIKFITHHCGALVPYFRDRIIVHYNNGLERLGADHYPGLTKHPIEYLRMFYNDTALNGNPSALNLALEFYGEDRILFGTDLPYDVENGRLSVKQTIDAIEKMGVSPSAKQKIYEGNARRLLHL
ncbi:MAG TPA: amidohydrolase family protein [Syntrophorhabdales bacterium]|nr:amidohydrolase family protein [Syntrophorhabdales bacterium]